MQGESSLVFSQGGSPQCAVSCFPSEVWPKALLQQFLTLYYKGIFRAFAIQWMRWRLLASSGPKARPEDYKPVEKTHKHERLSSVHLNAEVSQHTNSTSH